jgi:hypothetical protein
MVGALGVGLAVITVITVRAILAAISASRADGDYGKNFRSYFVNGSGGGRH